ncbi:MAG: hypothetical protein DRR42_03500 [Gammaproteobacteria bacterium]|nr:MAG: hypothetical protein DRR42_03500 [Gammaproteobacteria bacterium]
MTDIKAEESGVFFYQGAENIGGQECLKSIKKKIAELSNIRNVSFLLGAGASSYAIPSMKVMQEKIALNLGEDVEIDGNVSDLYQSVNSDNLETILTILYAKKHYLEGTTDDKPPEKGNAKPSEMDNVKSLIKHIERAMYSAINIDLSSGKAKINLELYKKFYQKIVLRNKDLSRISIFTTNNDLLSEKALDALNINFNNGFGGGLDRVFNPARFHYTFSKKIDANLEKFEPLDNMVYLHKLHGSISWVEQENNSLFNIQEIPVIGGQLKGDKKHVLIYPTPLKQTQSLGSPYSDLIREFQTKLSLPNSVIFIIGYSFSDEHLNNIIYQSLASNSSISVVIFGDCADCPLVKIRDNRIYRIFGTDEAKPYGEDKDNNIHYFKYIVEQLLSNVDDNADATLLEAFTSSLKALKSDDS